MFIPIKPIVKLANGNKVHSQVFGIFYVAFLTVTLNIQWDQIIIVRVTFPTPYDQVPSNFMLDYKRLHVKLLNIVDLMNLNVVLGDHLTRLKTITTVSK